MPCAAEMNSFEAEIGRDQRFVAAGQANYGTIVTDALDNSGSRPHTAADSLNQLFFEQRQDATNISVFRRRVHPNRCFVDLCVLCFFLLQGAPRFTKESGTPDWAGAGYFRNLPLWAWAGYHPFVTALGYVLALTATNKVCYRCLELSETPLAEPSAATCFRCNQFGSCLGCR